MNQDEVLAKLAEIGPARRGHVSEQWYTRKDKNGERRKNGPYYVWQRYVRGKKRSTRIARGEAEKALSEIRRGEEASALMEQFWENAEEIATTSKKKTNGNMLPR